MFRLTRAAAEQILRTAEIQGDAPSLRIAAKIDEDGERVYGVGFDDEREHDLVLDCEGVTILISPHSQGLLAGTTLDFVELKPGEFQFVFDNPNEPTCAPAGGGCASCGRGGSCG
ncbi:MAG: iron-sulfur cluster biosynthesis family protein [Rhodocyclaceae bacterium]|nr:iron-sulfur cluster biosynthesis family protein [Rhodocyclaceae bacterium]